MVVGERTVAERRAGLALALLGVCVLVLAVWPLPFAQRYLDLRPTPDAPEYVASAVSLLERGDQSIEVAGERFPSRYPIGYPLAIAGVTVLGVAPERAPFVVSAVAGLVLLVALWFGVAASFGPVAAGLSVLVLATTPGFLVLARAPMSDLTSCVFIVAAAFGLGAYAGRGALGLGLVGAFLLGFSTSVRVGNVLFAPLAVTLWVSGVSLRERASGKVRALGEGAGLAAAFVIGCGALAVSQWSTFGSPTMTGYAFWLAGGGDPGSVFSFDLLCDNVPYLMRELLQIEWRTTVAKLHGTGSYVGPVTVALALWAGWRALARRAEGPGGGPQAGDLASRRVARAVAAGLVGYGGLMLAYRYQDVRFFVPLFPFAAVLVGVQAAASWRAGRRTTRTLLAVLLLLHVLGVPGGAGRVADLPALLTRTPADRVSVRTELIDAVGAHEPGLVLATFNIVRVRLGLDGEGWTVVPAHDDHDYRWAPDHFVFSAPERLHAVCDAAAAGVPVYLIGHRRFAEVVGTVPVPDGFEWRIESGMADGGGWAMLVQSGR